MFLQDDVTSREYRRGVRIFLGILVCFGGPLIADYAIESSTFKLHMDQRTGSFSTLALGSEATTPLFENDHDPFSSFAGIVVNGNLIPLGGFQGRCEGSRIDGNTLFYCWTFKDIRVEQKIRITRDEKSEIIDWNWTIKKKSIQPVGFLLVLDPVSMELFRDDAPERLSIPSRVSNARGLVLNDGLKHYQITSTHSPMDFIVLEDLNAVKKSIQSSFSSVNGNKDKEENILGLYWRNATANTDTIINIRMKEVSPLFDPAAVVIISTQTVVIASNRSEISVTIKNRTITDLKNVTLRCVQNPAVQIHSDYKIELEMLNALAERTITLEMSSLSLIEQGNEIRFSLEYSVNKQQYANIFKKDVLLKKSSSLLDVEFIQDGTQSQFSLVQPSMIQLSNRNIEIKDQDDKTVRIIPLKPDEMLVKWDGMDGQGKLLTKGAPYSYAITGTIKESVFRSRKKNFVTDPDTVETPGGILFRFPAVNFGYDNAAIRSSAYPVLKKITGRMKEIGSTKTIQINGYTDRTGTKTKNIKLSIDRATAIKDYFIGVEGFQEKDFIINGLADEDPIAANDSEENRMKNRRVEIFIEK